MQKVPHSELTGVVEQVLQKLPQAKKSACIIALSGDLGAGKTTLTQALGKRLGVGEIIQSPTYVLMKSYTTANTRYKKLIHIDAYRLDSAKEFTTLNPSSFLKAPENLVCIEWPENLGEALPRPDLTINFSSSGASPGERYIQLIDPE